MNPSFVKSELPEEEGRTLNEVKVNIYEAQSGRESAEHFKVYVFLADKLVVKSNEPDDKNRLDSIDQSDQCLFVALRTGLQNVVIDDYMLAWEGHAKDDHRNISHVKRVSVLDQQVADKLEQDCTEHGNTPAI